MKCKTYHLNLNRTWASLHHKIKTNLAKLTLNLMILWLEESIFWRDKSLKKTNLINLMMKEENNLKIRSSLIISMMNLRRLNLRMLKKSIILLKSTWKRKFKLLQLRKPKTKWKELSGTLQNAQTTMTDKNTSKPSTKLLRYQIKKISKNFHFYW
jgi:hypothetical protein